MGAAADDEIVGNDAVTNPHRSAGVAVEAAVAQAAGSADGGAIPNAHAVNHLCVADFDVVADGSALALDRLHIIVNHLVQGRYQLWLVAVHCQDVGGLGAQAVIDLDLSAAGFVEHGHLGAVAKGADAVRIKQVHVLYIAVVADVIVGDVVADVLHQGVVPNGDVVKRCVPEAGVLAQASRKGKDRLEFTEAHLS